MALQLAEMQSFLQNRTAEDEYIQQQIQETFKELSKYVCSVCYHPPCGYCSLD